MILLDTNSREQAPKNQPNFNGDGTARRGRGEIHPERKSQENKIGKENLRKYRVF